MFLQEDGAGSAYKLTYNCVDCKDNQVTFNDGYHIQHHLNSQLHWSELPRQFLATIAEHGRHKGGCCYTCIPDALIQSYRIRLACLQHDEWPA